MNIHRRQFLTQCLALSATGLAAGSLTAYGDQAEEWKQKLSRHHIANLETGTVQLRWPRLVGKNSRLGVHGRGPDETVCRIITDQSATGWGPLLARSADKDAILAKFKGKALTDLFDPTVGITDPAARPLDFALHDLAGNILGIPVYEMLGHHGPESTLCYSGMIYFDDLEPEDKPAGIDKVLENCQFDVKYGYRQLKVKIGRGNKWMEKQAGIQRDIEVTRKIAELFPKIDILVDGNDGFTCAEFIQYLEGLGTIPLFWIEEPFLETIDDYVKLRAWLTDHKRKTLLADGEYNPDPKLLDELLQKRCIDVNLQDVCGLGFTPWRKLIPQMKAIGATTSPHAWGSALKTNYIAHLSTGLGNVVTIEGVTSACRQIDLSDYTLKDGKIIAPALPGFGMKLKI